MHFLKDTPIRGKITLLIVFACVSSLLITAAALVAFELVTYRQRALEDVRTQAAILAMNLHAPLTFDHPQAAEYVLQSLRLKPSIVAAAVIKPRGEYLAVYSKGSDDEIKLPVSPETGYDFSGGYLFLTRRVLYRQETVGYLFIQYSLENLFERLPGYGIAMLALLIALILVGIVLDSGFRNLVSRRLGILAHTARQISNSKDFSLRASADGDDELGVFTHVLNTMLDTIEKQNREIRHSEERLRLAMEASRTGVWQWNPDNHRITIAASFISFAKPNDGDMRSVETTLSEKEFLAYVHPNDRKQLLKALYKSNENRRVLRCEFRFRATKTATSWLSIRGKFVSPSGGGEMLGVVHDITTRKEAELALMKSENRLRTILDTVDEVVFSFRMKQATNYGFEFFSKATLKTWGYEPQELIDNRELWLSRILEEDREHILAPALDTLLHIRPASIEYRFRRKNDTIRIMESTFIPHGMPDGSVQVIATAIDVTEQRHTENSLRDHASELGRANNELRETNRRLDGANAKLKELDVLKTEFVSMASHELRTPLTGILGFAEALISKDIKLSEKERSKYIGIIVQESKRLGLLITDLLDISRIEKGTHVMSEAQFDMKGLLKDTLKVLEIPQDIKVMLSVPNEDPLVVRGDRNRIKQVILNILDNAVRQTAPDGRIYVSAGMKNNRVLVSIRDSGPGIKQEELDKIFDKFYRSKYQMDAESNGSGLGLAIAKQIIDAHNGAIWAESEYGKGATLHISLPTTSVSESIVSHP